MKAFCATCLCLAGVSAFVPPAGFQRAVSRTVESCSALQQSLRGEAGATAPFENGFDPAGIASSPSVDEKQMQKYREAELKHSRVAMLAVVGMLTQEKFHPFFGTAGRDLGPASFHLQQVDNNFPQLSLALLFAIGLVEAFTIGKGWSKQDYQDDGVIANLKSSYVPGDLGFDPLGLKPQDEQGFKDMQSKELNNGRLAMVAIFGFWAQELVDGQSIWGHWGL